MLQMTPTHYSTLPSVPQINAMPQGIPRGPWHSLYRTAPGASLPSQSLLGNSGGVQIVGAGLGGIGDMSTGKKVAFLVLNSAILFGVGATFALARQSSHPVLYPGLVFGGYSAVTGLALWAIYGGSKKSAAVPAPAP